MLSDLLKKLMGVPAEPEIRPLKPGINEKSVGALDYEIAKRKAQQQREMGNPFTPHDDTPGTGDEPIS